MAAPALADSLVSALTTLVLRFPQHAHVPPLLLRVPLHDVLTFHLPAVRKHLVEAGRLHGFTGVLWFAYPDDDTSTDTREQQIQSHLIVRWHHPLHVVLMLSPAFSRIVAGRDVGGDGELPAQTSYAPPPWFALDVHTGTALPALLLPPDTSVICDLLVSTVKEAAYLRSKSSAAAANAALPTPSYFVSRRTLLPRHFAPLLSPATSRQQLPSATEENVDKQSNSAVATTTTNTTSSRETGALLFPSTPSTQGRHAIERPPNTVLNEQPPQLRIGSCEAEEHHHVEAPTVVQPLEVFTSAASRTLGASATEGKPSLQLGADIDPTEGRSSHSKSADENLITATTPSTMMRYAPIRFVVQRAHNATPPSFAIVQDAWNPDETLEAALLRLFPGRSPPPTPFTYLVPLPLNATLGNIANTLAHVGFGWAWLVLHDVCL